MADKLVMCFYDGMSKENAIKFLETAYGKKVRDVSIKTARNGRSRDDKR